MTMGVASGHPSTTGVGIRALQSGGTAADAAVAAALASCVTETVLTGIGGGGFATHYHAATGSVTCLDFFCSVPGLDGATARPMVPIDITFGSLPQQFAIGGASVAVPGVPAGLAEVHRRWGRLPWNQVVAPAIELATTGVPLPPAHARALSAVAPALTPGQGALVYAPAGHLLSAGDLLFHPGLAEALTMLARDGAAAFYTGEIAAGMVAAVSAAGGALCPADLASYRVRQLPVDLATITGHDRYGRCHVLGRRDLSRTVATLASLPQTLTKLPREERAVCLADALLANSPGGYGCTTNLAVVDAGGDACVITTTMGVGSGVWIPNTGIHLNSMLGEGELVSPASRPGDRMSSNMCPLVVVDETGSLVLAAGSAGASRIRSALVHTLVNVLVADASVPEAIARPRFHAVAGPGGGPATVHAEYGYPEDELRAISVAGYDITRWDQMNHYFGGVSAVGKAGASGDPRRGGSGVLI